MTQSPGLLLTILAFAAVIGPLIFVHELGHYLVGRWFGIKADIFSIGFGREIAGWTDGQGTRWKLSALPLGGYVKFAGDMTPASQPSTEWLALPAAERARTFQAKPVWQRAAVVAAGPAVNFLAAFLILMVAAIGWGDERTPATVGGVGPGSAAAHSDLRVGDRIVAMNGRSMHDFMDLYRYVKLRPGETVHLELVRGGQAQARDLVLGADETVDRFGNHSRFGLLGVAPPMPVTVAVPVWQAPAVAFRRTGEYLRFTADTLGQLVSGRRSIRDMQGPVGMARAAGETLALGWEAFVALIVLVSINLGFMNLLPVPMLDGGHLMFYAIEAVRRRPVGPEAQEWAFRGGLAALLGLMLVVTFNDLGSLGLWKGLAGLIG